MCTVGLGSTTHDPSFTTVLGKEPASVGSVCASSGVHLTFPGFRLHLAEF